MIRCRIYYVTKLEFLPVFRNVYRSALSEQNIRSGFRATGLIPLNPDVVLSDLHAMTKTPTPPPEISQNPTVWTSKTPQNSIELNAQVKHIQTRILRHQNSSPSTIINAVDQLAKGAQIMMHSATILKAEIVLLQQANAHKKRRQRQKRRQIMQNITLTIQEGLEIVRNGSNYGEIEETESSRGIQEENSTSSTTKKPRCRLCQNTGHNARTCAKRQISTVA